MVNRPSYIVGDDQEGRANPKTQKDGEIDRKGPPQILKLHRSAERTNSQ